MFQPDAANEPSSKMAAQLNVSELFQQLQPELRQLDAERLAVKAELRKNNLIWIPVIGAIGVGVIWAASHNLEWAVYILSPSGFLAYIILALTKIRIKKKFARDFKARVIGTVIQKIDPSFTYVPDKILCFPNDRKENPAVERIISSTLFPPFVDVWVEDVIEGSVGNNRFHFAELHFVKERKTIYSGIMMTAFTDTPFPSPVYVIPVAAPENKGFRKFFHALPSQGDRVELHNPEFEARLKVFAPDPEFARSLMQTFITRRLLHIYQKVESVNQLRNSVKFAFYENQIVIAIQLKVDLFEPRLHTSINNKQYLEKNLQYLMLLLNLTQDLNVSSS